MTPELSNSFGSVVQEAMRDASEKMRLDVRDDVLDSQEPVKTAKKRYLEAFRYWYRDYVADMAHELDDLPDNHHDVAERRAMEHFVDEVMPWILGELLSESRNSAATIQQ